jgi:hypothetical protein
LKPQRAAILATIGMAQDVPTGLVHGEDEQGSLLRGEGQRLEKVAQALPDGAKITGGTLERKFDHSGW